MALVISRGSGMNKKLILSVLFLVGCATCSAVSAQEGMPELAKKSGCTVCHEINVKLIGPAWMDVSKRYKGATGYAYSPRGSAAADAEKMSLVDGLVMKMTKGGSGNWGSAAKIASSPRLSDADLRTLVRFILDLAK